MDHGPAALRAACAVALAFAGCRFRDTARACDPTPCPPFTECDSATGACAPISCPPGQTRCSPTEPRALDRCNSSGDTWTRVGRCTAEQSCEGGPMAARCTPPSCVPGSAVCDGDGRVRWCIVGVPEDPVPCPPGEVCDPALGSTCVPAACPPGAFFCLEETDAVGSCNALGTAWDVIETCDPGAVCTSGTCFTLCDLAELEGNYEGCVYYGLDTNNVSRDDPLGYTVAVANRSTLWSAEIVIEVRAGSGALWSLVASGTVAPATIGRFELPDRHAEGTALSTALAYRLSSSLPVTAWQINSDDAPAAASSAGATTLFSRAALGTGHTVVTLPTSTGDDALFAFGPEIHHGGFAVIGVYDGTDVTVTATAPTAAGAGVPALAAGDSWNTTLNEGDVLQFEAASAGDDLTGSTVTSAEAVAVIAHHECATIDPGTCDHLEEQLPPWETWGTTFANGRFLSPGATHLWRILAAEDGTVVTHEYAPGTTGLPGPSGSSFTLDAGEWQDLFVAGPGAPGEPASADFYMWSDRPVYVAQFSTGEVSMASSHPLEYWPMEYLVGAGPAFDDAITVVKHASAIVTLDGAPLPDAEFAFLPPDCSVYRGALADGAHVLVGAAPSELDGIFSLWLSGAGPSASYAYAAALNRAWPGFRCARAPDGSRTLCLR